jgi:hypothetical protein
MPGPLCIVQSTWLQLLLSDVVTVTGRPHSGVCAANSLVMHTRPASSAWVLPKHMLECHCYFGCVL